MSGYTDPDVSVTPIATGKRAAPRLRLSLPARLQTMYDTRRGILLDLSKTGAQIGLEEPLREGASAILELQGIDQFGTVVRSGQGVNGGVIGLKFDHPLGEADVLAIRRYSDTYEESEMRALRNEARAWVAGVVLRN